MNRVSGFGCRVSGRNDTRASEPGTRTPKPETRDPMYKLHLILKYLRKRRIAWVSLIAVMLCTAMVLVVISVMGGWLRMFRESFHGLSGDVIVKGRSLTGFPHYQTVLD